MISIALFPCTFINGATLVGELSIQLGLMVYTDELLCGDMAHLHAISAERSKEVLFGRKSPGNSRTLEKERMVNLFRRHLVAKLREDRERTLFYGRLAALFTPSFSSVFRVLVTDSDEARIVRGMKQEGCSPAQAARMIEKHDASVSQWTNFLHGRMAYDPTLYDAVITYNGRDVFTVTNDIIACYIQREGLKGQETAAAELQNLALSLEVEQALLEEGYVAEVKAQNRCADLQIRSSSFHFPWLSEAMAKRALTVSGVDEVTISNAVGSASRPKRRQQAWFPNEVFA